MPDETYAVAAKRLEWSVMETEEKVKDEILDVLKNDMKMDAYLGGRSKGQDPVHQKARHVLYPS